MNVVSEKMCFYVAGLLTALNRKDITDQLKDCRGNIAIRHSNVVRTFYNLLR